MQLSPVRGARFISLISKHQQHIQFLSVKFTDDMWLTWMTASIIRLSILRIRELTADYILELMWDCVNREDGEFSIWNVLRICLRYSQAFKYNQRELTYFKSKWIKINEIETQDCLVDITRKLILFGEYRANKF